VRVALRDAGGRALAFRWLEGPELAARLRVFRPDGRELPLVTALPARGRALLLLPRLTLPPGFTGAGRVEVEVPQPTGRPLTVALQPRPVPSKSLRFKLPVRGTWRAVRGPADQGLLRRAAVVEGGRLYLPRRYALDLVAVDRRGERPRGAPRNEDYPAFGAPVYAPFAGTVTAAVDGHADNPPGMMSPTTTFGNHLRLEHPGGARTLLAHLQQGSLKVKAGDQVRVGALLAAVGNSGRSAEPHLYLEVCDGERPRCQGLPVIFDAFEVPAVTGWRPITDSAIDEGWVLKAP